MKPLVVLLLALIPFLAIAQTPISGDEFGLTGKPGETSGICLILDNSRTKVGKDFYELFYKHWSALPTQADMSDTSQPDSLAPVVPTGDVVITVEEIPAPGTTSQILISIDDQPIWHQFVQARYELLEEDALHAVETVRQYLVSNQEMQQLLGSQDQQGSGVY